MIRKVLPALAVLTGCHAASAEDIKNFRSGLVCFNPDSEFGSDGQSEVCFETVDIVITGQSACVFDGQTAPCTWYGFEFEFSPALAGKRLVCVSQSDRQITYGGPRGIETNDAAKYEYLITLPQKPGRFFNPQFGVFSEGREHDKVIHEETVCAVEGAELFRFKFRFLHPATHTSKNDRH